MAIQKKWLSFKHNILVCLILAPMWRKGWDKNWFYKTVKKFYKTLR